MLISKSETGTNLDAVIHHHIPVFTSQDLEVHHLVKTVPFPPKVFEAIFCTYLHLEDGEASLEEVIKGGSRGLGTKFPTKQLRISKSEK